MSDFDPELDDEYLDAPIAPSQYHSHDTEVLLERLRDMIDSAPNVPLSSTPRISREEATDLLDEALVRFPEELKAARWLLKEREQFLARMQHEGDEILEQARARAERMVQRTEVVKAAETRAYQILDTAEAEARRLRHEVEDFCDQKLASFEIVLERTLKMVSSGRAKLQGTNLAADLPVDATGHLDPHGAGSSFGAPQQPETISAMLGETTEEQRLADLPPPPAAPAAGDDGELFDDAG
jgi:hypothetical protein